MQKLVQALRAGLGRRVRPRHRITVENATDLVELAYWIDRPPLRMMVEPRHLRMQGGFVYGPSHPFVAALRDGAAALRRFYSAVEPITISEYYQIAADGRAGSLLPPWEIPWYGRKERLPPPGERGLGAEHGVSFHGPATEEKTALEFSRLSRLATSIESAGYDPDAYGDIEGYVLHDRGSAAFFVRGGKHRAAVLTHLGWERIPVAFRPGFPRLVDAAQSEFWTLVRSGSMDAILAREILGAYVTGRTGW
jgi:hypothetical protein